MRMRWSPRDFVALPSIALVTIVSCLLSAGFGYSVASAATYYVNVDHPNANDAGPGTETEPYLTIGAADRRRGGPGTTILVAPGTYNESVSIRSGTPEDPYVIRAAGPGVRMDGRTPYSDSALWQPGPNGTWSTNRILGRVWVDGQPLQRVLGYQPATLPLGTFTEFDSKTYLQIGGHPAQHDVRVPFYSTAIRVGDGTHGVVIEGFEIQYYSLVGIYLYNCSQVTVRGNTFTNCDQTGINATGGAFVIEDNVVSGCAWYGISLLNSNGSIVRRNRSFTNYAGIRAYNSHGTRFEGNELFTNYNTGLSISNSQDNLSLQNRSYDNDAHGFGSVDSPGIRHINDVAYGNRTEGFSFEGGSTGAQIWNSIAAENAHHDVFADTSSTDGFVSDYNVVWNSGPTTPVRFGSISYPTLAAFTQATGHDAHSSESDPRFADPASGDFRLTSGSKAIDSGNSLAPNWSLLDAEGAPRVDDPVAANTGVGPVTYSDRGALEFARSGPVDVESPGTPALALGPGHPNPAREGVSFALVVPRPGRVAWSVTDVAGREVWSDSRMHGAGATTLRWNTSDSKGRRVPPGIYLVRIDVEGAPAAMRRVAVVR